MLRISPFAALRPRPDAAQRVASPPYDVLDTDEARDLAEGNPDSFLHVIRPEIDLPKGTNPYAKPVYDQAAAAFTSLIDRGVLIREDRPRLYLYRQQATVNGSELSQIGVVARCHIDDYLNDVIKKHEKTRQAKEDDRTNHVLAIKANAGPVFLMHDDLPEIARHVERDTQSTPLYDFTADDGVRHTVWHTPDHTAYTDAFATLPAAYVADGHHRSASAARAGAQLRQAHPDHTGDEPYNWFLTVLFPASQLTILPYHRVIKGLNGLTPDELINRLDSLGRVDELPPDSDHEPANTGTFCIYLAERWFALTLDDSAVDRSDPVASLDYELLTHHVLGPLLGIGDLRSDERIDFVGGIRGPAELRARVDSGRADIAFALHAVTVAQLKAVADAGKIMPPKCTWFEPKLRSGLLVHTLD